MKNLILIAVLLTVTLSFSQQQQQQQQQDTVHARIFCLTPLSKKVNKVNGLAFGLGHGFDKDKVATINGLNLEINPIIVLAIGFLDPEKLTNDTITLRHNGLHISTFGFLGNVAHNGVGISVCNVTYSSNGLSITALYNMSKNLNGLHIAGITNSTDRAVGLLIAPVNSADVFKGVQLGVYNKSGNMAGVQVGLFNKTGKARGVQLGLWNKNNKRSLPFINWNFKD